ncbi:response regulator [Parafilimonas terrae]|jgi:two-component system response regulator|uniref:Two-component system, unclassified family, response regulator n=1 Tax=Parafilimonas terrae TaxID=1465490 RepID=A0A1I5YHJ9_9BACT|nr:response regulator [Parafilimonas terrae]SFQ43377.1 two-component system, unclassified family, response regulator [Parafilimonas terrae]
MPEAKKILMVDDDAEDRMLMQDMFTEIGVPDVACYADSGETALHYLEDLPDDKLPSVILLDLNMPRLNGTQVLKILKQNEKLKDITVIIYSTSVNNIEKEQSLKLGAHSYVIKPSSYNGCIEKAKYFNSLCREGEEKN